MQAKVYNLWKGNTLTYLILYSSSSHDTTDPQTKYHMSFIPSNVTVHANIPVNNLYKTYHGNVLRMAQLCIILFFVADKEFNILSVLPQLRNLLLQRLIIMSLQ